MENMSLIWTTVATGISVVFMVLLFLIIIIFLMGKLFSLYKPSRKPVTIAKPAVKPSAAFVQPATVAEPQNDLEVIAVIAAAIRAYSESSGKRIRIVSVRKREPQNYERRSLWGNAGVRESMTN